LRNEIRTAGGFDRVSLIDRRLLGNCGAKEKDQRLQGNGDRQGPPPQGLRQIK
jgi:hypothetical protein